MNGKKARALRKAVGFHPAADRTYVPMQVVTSGSSRITELTRTNVNKDSTPRALYLAAKKAAKHAARS